MYVAKSNSSNELKLLCHPISPMTLPYVTSHRPFGSEKSRIDRCGAWPQAGAWVDRAMRELQTTGSCWCAWVGSGLFCSGSLGVFFWGWEGGSLGCRQISQSFSVSQSPWVPDLPWEGLFFPSCPDSVCTNLLLSQDDQT